MPFRFTGDNPLLYTQYRDLGTDRPLQAAPGASYDMAPVGGWDLPVPPADGRWESAAATRPASPPAPLIASTTASTEGGEN